MNFKFPSQNRKSQVTLFIILGIVVVVAFAGVFIAKDYILKSEFEREANKIEVVDDFAPLYNSYKDCVSDITKDGIEILASQGGYIDIPEYEYVVNPLIPFSNKLDMFNDGNVEVAYWFYETGNGIQTEKIPTLESMQNELKNYINENLYSCGLNLTSYEGYTTNNFDNFNINVQIKDSKVFVEILSDFNVNYKGVNQQFNDLKVVVDSPLGYLYSKAIELYNKQMQENYFEEKTIDYLIIYDSIPYSGESFTCSPRMWSKQNIEKDLKEILEVNTDAFGKVDEKYYKIDLGDSNLDMSFMYRKEWPFFMQINGGDEVLQESSVFGDNTQAANFLNALFCLNSFRFIYDIKYPILATLNKNGLDFNFAFETIIDNNQPKYNLLGSDLIELDDRLCDAKNKYFTIYAIDYETQQTLDNADVKLSCVGTSCELGKTELDEFNDYSFSGYVPACVNADIKTYKENYFTGKLTVSTNEEGSAYAQMKPYHALDVRIKIVEGSNIRDSYDDEEVFVNFINEEDGFNQFLNGDNTDLIVGDYTIRSYIMSKSNKPITIPGDEVEYCSDIPKTGVLGYLGLKDKKCYTNKLEDVELDQVLVGGNEFEWSYEGTGSQLTIYVNYDKIPKTVSEMADIYEGIFDKNKVRSPELI